MDYENRLPEGMKSPKDLQNLQKMDFDRKSPANFEAPETFYNRLSKLPRIRAILEKLSKK